MIHGKFLKINQELHRIQQVYQDLRHQYPNDDVEPVRTFKKQMEKGWFTWSPAYKKFSMLNSAETKIYPAHKCLNAYNCWHFNIYEQDKLQA